jgi:large subunit ribosomal protein L15
MLQLNNLEKTTEARKRVGRGGKRGRYSGNGKGGQKSRTGSSKELKASFEGGQMPLVRRIPRRGFTNIFRIENAIINVRDLEVHFNVGDVVNEATLREKGLVKGKKQVSIKVLGDGKISKKLTVHVDAVSASATQAIQDAGGTVQLQ